ncbi:sugar transferase [Flavobacterium lutivivi]|nr:sugar transferase [Flavobacterium lutivivi]
MKLLTIFTPTYNRAYCLHQLYESLVGQTNKDFLWLVIDDGSSDNTYDLVQSWIAQNKIEIQYIKQENQGMHGGHNTAYKNIKTELNTCIDSDDYMPNDAVDKIIKTWDRRDKSMDTCGIIGLDAYKDNRIVGTKIPDEVKYASLNELYSKYKIKGDKKVVLQTEIVKKYPAYPIFTNERFVPLGILYTLIGNDYVSICSNDVYCIVEYLPDGSSRNIFRQYKKNPLGFRYSRIIEMQYSHSFSYTFTRAMHFISSSIFARKGFFKENPKPLITFFALPFGLLLHVYILFKIKK